jgi:predicted dehydrogenase
MGDDLSMPAPVEAILIGAGNRGAEAYAPYALRHPEQLRFVAVAEPDPARRERFAAHHHLPAERQFPDWEALLAGPRLGQAALICTQDQLHTAPALAALHAGYDVLLEKPMATTPEACRQIVAAVAQTGRQLQVCHVLRYTRHFRQLREIVQSGRLGQIVDVAHRENVSYWHMAHSYVRGNWRNQAQSSPMILAKCCHDFDMLIWVLGGHPERLYSLGSLAHFRPEFAPAGAPPRCLDGCPAASTCPYYAPFIYIELLPIWRSLAASTAGYARLAVELQLRAPWLIKALSRAVPPLRQLSDYRGWPRSVIAADPAPENLLEALRTGPYGRCVYHCDNDVVDHQVVAMQFTGGTSVTLTMQGHSYLEGRTTRIEGARATLQAFFGLGGSWIDVHEHRSGRRTRFNTSDLVTGHGGGDAGLMAAFVRSVRQGSSPGSSSQSGAAGGPLTSAQQALESHLLAFAAEKSRLAGQEIDMTEPLPGI